MAAADLPGSAPRFSIVVLTRNEAWALPRLLWSLDDFIERGGEVLVLDTGSTDATVAIARGRGCRVELVHDQFDAVLGDAQAAEITRCFSKEPEADVVLAGQRLFHFGDARQHAGLLAANRFVLQLDASDEVPALDIDAFDRWIEAGDVDSFEYDQLYGQDPHGKQATFGLRIARFYDRTCYHWEGRVHEVLSASGRTDATAAPRMRCDPTQLAVFHHKDPIKQRNYLAGLALQVLECPQTSRWWHYLGRELLYVCAYESAIAALEQHAAMEGAWTPERSQSLCFMGESLEALGRVSEAKEVYRRAFAVDPTRREPLLRLAATYCRLGEFEVAARCASQSLTIPRTNPYPELEGNYTWVPHSLLYWSLFWLGKKDQARAHWETCRSMVPEDDTTREHARLFPPASVAAGEASPQPAADC
jgi:tetratricopeptide (TPR) repeat protein